MPTPVGTARGALLRCQPPQEGLEQRGAAVQSGQPLAGRSGNEVAGDSHVAPQARWLGPGVAEVGEHRWVRGAGDAKLRPTQRTVLSLGMIKARPTRFSGRGARIFVVGVDLPRSL